MEKPLCKICKERHYGLCPSASKSVDDRIGRNERREASLGTPVARSKPSPPKRAKVDQPSVSDQGRQDQPRDDVRHDERKERAPKPPAKATDGREAFDRVKYQREYMRKRRSKLALNRGET